MAHLVKAKYSYFTVLLGKTILDKFGFSYIGLSAVSLGGDNIMKYLTF
jgi:hypothetical protein